MAGREWFVVAYLMLAAVQLGVTVDPIPEDAAVRDGNCSQNAFGSCTEGTEGCVDLDNNRYYCKCIPPDTGDGLINGTGCGAKVFTCNDKSECHEYAVCQENNTCACKNGYEGDGSSCIDIDECDQDPCVANSICRNELGSYQCTCKPTFEEIDGQCIFKCRVNQECHDDGECVDEECKCSPGYEGDGVATCDDINECATGDFECDENADCVNEKGSYSCECHDGYDGDGKTCVKLPKNCQEIYEARRSSETGTYTIDTDGTGPIAPISVKCEMRNGMGITVIFPEEEAIRRSPDGGSEEPIEYPATPEQMKPLIDDSVFCSQEFWIKCQRKFNLQSFVSWEDLNGNRRTGWGTATDGMCPCGEVGVCQDTSSPCNCDGNNSDSEVDAGYIVDKAILPATKVTFGNTNINTDWSVGPLRCGPKSFDILKDCHEIREERNVKLNGPQLIDVDGADGPLDPVLVYCDMQTYRNLGVTVITPNGSPDVVFTESGTRPIGYKTPLPVVEALVKGSVHCDQTFEYECQNGKQDVTVNVGNDNRPINYLPGGISAVPGSCGCGVTNTCDELNVPCNCAIDDGQTRKDIGVQIDRNDLPIVAVNVEFNGQKRGVSVVGPLRCSSSQFGIEPNCEKYRSLGYNVSYTYLIDPDGPPVGNANVVPFRAQCVMQAEPPMGITIIQHSSRSSVRFDSGNLNLDLVYPFVSPEQLDALKSRCTYVEQDIKLSCNKFALHPPSGTSYYASWFGVGSDRRRHYWSGDATYNNCHGPNGEDVCQCDSSETSATTMIDDGHFTKKEHLPVGKVDFERADIDGNGYVELELGPFKCFEVFPTCAVVFSTARSRAKFGEVIPEDGRFTLDPDGSGEVEAFVVDCDFPFTTLPVVPPVNELTNTGTDPVEECFDISYLDGVGNTLDPSQVIGLVKASNGNCKQSLSLTCSNAPITDLIYFETCDGKKQTGWAGSGGADSCSCGLTGTCEGGLDAKCNCDIEDGKERQDGGIIVDNDRLPICKVCIKLNGTAPGNGENSSPSRSASFQVSDLVCSKNKMGVSPNCQKARIGSDVSESGTIYVKADPEPIPVYCDFRAYPPSGVLQMFPEQPNIEVPPNEDFDEFIVYKVFNMTQLTPLINQFDYCTQRLTVSCQDASLNIQGDFGWYSRDGVVQNYWTNSESGGPCSGDGGECNCNLAGSQEDSGLIIDQSALPITRIKFEASSGTRNVFLGPLECYDIKKDCYDIMKSGDKSTVYWSNSTYVIDPDGPGPVDPFLVVCEFDSANDNAITIAYPATNFPMTISNTGSVPFEIPLSYTGATPEQLNALAKQSQFCLQGVLYVCKESPIGDITLADGSVANGFGLADDITTIGCACGKLGTCGTESACRCDNKGPMGDFDRGYITAKDELPVTKASFGDQDTPNAVGKLTIEELKCSPKPDDLPKNCKEASEMGMVSGEILINPSEDIPPFIVFCDMTMGTGVARVKPVDDPDKPVTYGSTDVDYKGLTDEQLTALVASSDYCYQPVLIDCFQSGFIKDGYFSWAGPDGTVHRYWGNGDPAQQTCTCGAEKMCGGEGGKDDMSQRKCNCDIGDAVWRKDGGVMRIKDDLPIRRYRFDSVLLKYTAKANMTVGDLYCGMEEIDLPVCEMGFDDCGENAVCEGKSVSDFECQCIKGYQGLVNGQGINDQWANGRQCFDNDECSYLSCPYSADCFNFPGDFNCTCHEGYIKTGKTTCDDINECEEDTHDCHQDAKCENTDGSFNCKCKRGYVGDGRTCEPQGQCACFGDPHCISYDQKWLHFMGVCEYTMSRDNCDGGQPTFEVILKNWNRDKPIDASWVKEVVVVYQGTNIQLRQGREIRVNGQLAAAYAGSGFTVADYGRQVKVTTISGLTVTWDGQDAVQITAGKNYKGKLCGLCGNYNDDSSDDWTRGPRCPDDGPPITTNNNLFANSWSKTNPTCDVDCDSPPYNNPKCKMDPVFATMMCDSILNRALSIFSSCLPKLDPIIMSGLYMTCNMDMCLSPNTNMDNLCDVGERVAQECSNIGEMVPLWRNVNGLKCGVDKCGVNMVESVCGGMANSNPGPVQTCIGYRTGADPSPSPSCISGCFCEENYYLDGSDCVPENECGCIYTKPNGESSYMRPGELLVDQGCGSYRTCTEGNVVESEALVCDANANCNLDNETGVYGCHCKEGFMGDGESCSEDPCFMVNCADNQECVEGKCQCEMGYTADCEQCVDIDECATGIHNCTKLGQLCVNIAGDYFCECDEGFLNVDGLCVDFDECKNGQGDCPTHAECKNTKGGYECVCCAGFKKNVAVCVPDGTGLQDVGNEEKCCSCFGDVCDKTGKVCGSDGVTYNSEKAMIITACKQGEYISKSYDGPCRVSCAGMECERPNQVCTVEDGTALCRCPKCSESEANVTIESVCSSTHLMFKSRCNFERYACGVGDSEVTIVSTGKECEGSGAGMPMGQWTPWSNCSVDCGTGFVTRSRTPVNGAVDASGKPYRETVVAQCYRTCPEGPCTDNTCPASEVCVVDSVTNAASCQCPDCTNRGDDPVCGRVGNMVKTYINLCDLEKDACQKKLPMTLVQDFACEVEPLDCAKKALWEIRKDSNGCSSPFMDFGQCGGGCGEDPSRCCTPIIRTEQLKVRCAGSAGYYTTMDIITACECQDKGSQPVPQN